MLRQRYGPVTTWLPGTIDLNPAKSGGPIPPRVPSIRRPMMVHPLQRLQIRFFSPFVFTRLFAVLCGLVFACGPALRADQTPPSAPVSASAKAQHQHLVQFLRKRLPDSSQDVIDRTANDFLDHLRQTSSMAVERFESGSMEDDELQSRVDVFVADRRVEKDQEAAIPGVAAEPSQVDTAASEQIQRQEISQLLQKKLPEVTKDAVDKAAKEFLTHLRQTSPLAAERFGSGHMDQDDLASRIDIFLGESPELSGKPAATAPASLRARVVDLLKRNAASAQTDKDRQDIADRFIRSLGDLSETTRDNLLSGRISDDELQSRVTVFAADRQVAKAQVVTDPAVAAVPAIVDAFEKANFGLVTERVEAICFRGSVDEGGVKRDLVIFKKRPNRVRIHVVENGLVVGIIGYDGNTGWRQPMAKQATRITGRAAESLAESSRFDDPIVGMAERGASARLESKPGEAPLRLRISEKDGTTWVETIDPANYNELSLVKTRKDGSQMETRFRDYRKVGNINVAFEQEQWVGGVLRSTTRVTDVSLDPGLLDRFFDYPANPNLGYMDFMGGLAVLQAHEKAGAAPKGPPAGVQP